MPGDALQGVAEPVGVRRVPQRVAALEPVGLGQPPRVELQELRRAGRRGRRGRSPGAGPRRPRGRRTGGSRRPPGPVATVHPSVEVVARAAHGGQYVAMKGFRVLLLAVVVAALAFAVLAPPWAAEGLPGDPPVTAIAPASGAVLPVDPDGIPVVYGCPVYRSYDAGDGFVVYGGRPEYNVYFATSPALGRRRPARHRQRGRHRRARPGAGPRPGGRPVPRLAVRRHRPTRRPRRAPTTGRPSGSARAAPAGTRPGPCSRSR